MIRPALPDDLPHLVSMGLRFVQDTCYKAHLKPDPAQMEKTARWLMEHGALFVAEHAGTPVGMIGVVALPDPFSGDLIASEMFWWSDLPGTGVRLLKVAEAWAKEIGATRLQMVAPNDTVANLYDRLGYRMTERAYMVSLEGAGR